MDDVEAPDTWIKWTVPAFEYFYIKVDNEYGEVLSHVLDYMENNNIKLEGTVI